MTKNISQRHLYVFLASSGLVKIGRSRAPLERKRSIESNSGLQLWVVRILKDEGHRERAILKALQRYRHHGEWFTDSLEFRREASRVFGVELKFRTAIRDTALGHKSDMAVAVRAMCIEGKTPEQIKAWDRADDAYDRFSRGELTWEEFSEIWAQGGMVPLSPEDFKYGP